MKQPRSILLLAFGLLAVSVLGQSSKDSLSYQTILFRVTKPHSPNVSYLFGTHHAFGQTFFDSLTTAKQCLYACDVLIKENIHVPGQTATDVINNRETETNWAKYVSKIDLAFIRNLFATSPTDYNKLTPAEMHAFLIRYYNQTVCLGQDSSDTFLTLDDYIGQIAEEQNIALMGLETTEDQLEMINQDVAGMPKKVHKKRLHMAIEKIKAPSQNNCSETDWYRNMHIDYQLNNSCTNTLMLTNRNENWMKTILPALEIKNCFIVLGLSHLKFTCGLINQLREQGYEVRPIQVN